MPSSKHFEIKQELRETQIAMDAPPGGSTTRVGGQNIVAVEVPTEQEVHSFEAGPIRDMKGVKYSAVVGGIVDHSKAKDARFRLSELARAPLSVTAEEEARVAAEVERLLAIRLEEVRDATAREAKEVGMAEGREQGRQEVFAETRPAIEAFRQVVATFENMRTEIFKANEEFLIRLVYGVAKAVILRELREDGDYIKRLIVHLLDRLGSRENIKIYVGEKVFSSGDALKADLAQMYGQLKNVSIELASDIPDLGCKVETEFGEVDARIEVQLETIAQTLGVKNVQQ